MGEVRGEIQVAGQTALKLVAQFSPPRFPIGTRPEVFYCNCAYNAYSKQVPGNMGQVSKLVNVLPTRLTDPNVVE